MNTLTNQAELHNEILCGLHNYDSLNSLRTMGELSNEEFDKALSLLAKAPAAPSGSITTHELAKRIRQKGLSAIINHHGADKYSMQVYSLPDKKLLRDVGLKGDCWGKSVSTIWTEAEATEFLDGLNA